MWCFAWVLELAPACCFGILNAIWFEVHSANERDWLAVRNDP
ncbi:MAG: cytochrome bd-I oxidase subunit CydX [Rhodanobacteraceae bacterium]